MKEAQANLQHDIAGVGQAQAVLVKDTAQQKYAAIEATRALQRGVEHVIAMLKDQLRSVMQLSGVTTLAELRKHGAELVTDSG